MPIATRRKKKKITTPRPRTSRKPRPVRQVRRSRATETTYVGSTLLVYSPDRRAPECYDDALILRCEVTRDLIVVNSKLVTLARYAPHSWARVEYVQPPTLKAAEPQGDGDPGEEESDDPDDTEGEIDAEGEEPDADEPELESRPH